MATSVIRKVLYFLILGLFLLPSFLTIIALKKARKVERKEEPLSPIQRSESEVEKVQHLKFSAWIVWWDWGKGLAEFQENKNLFETVSPFVFVLTEDGKIEFKVVNLDEEFEKLKGGSQTKIIPTIYNQFDGERVSKIINSEELVQDHVEEISDLVSEYDLDGIEIDYEYLLAQDRKAYSNFIKQLSDELHKEGKNLSVTVHPKTSEKGSWDGAEAQDWFTLGKHADFIRVMIYDYHWGDSDSGPIAPLPWFEKVIGFAKSKIPTEKIVVGIGMYGYDWEKGEQKGKPLTLSEVDELLEKSGVNVQYSKEYLSPFMEYEANGKNHMVWFENELSVESKMESIKRLGISNICIWRLGGIPARFYNLLKNGL